MSGRPTPAADGNEESSPVVTPEIAAEAAVWIARLHGPDRSSRMERECLAWQGRSAAHRLAFERCTETWQDVPRVTLGDAFAAMAREGARSETAARPARAPRSRRSFALGIVAVLLIGGACLQLWRTFGVYSTGVGEELLVVLEDGTRLSLNTDSRVRVSMDSSRRGVAVESGEALFEVAKDSRRPFVVRAAGSEVVALGTVFSVRFEPRHLRVGDTVSVTLVQGQVTVRSIATRSSKGAISPWSLTMKPGDRLRHVGPATGDSDAPSTVEVDRPRIESVMAWKRNEAMFDDVALADAIIELNRYNRTPIVLVGDASLARLRVSGVYRTGDTAGFARDVAALHGLVVHEREGRLELAKPQ
ncbi:FecR protein domain-containing protein OS=Rhizobacter gummiphilus OX=946333 GN=A4W93_00725 PE=4 SV=1 [Rhizobacter fulvus]|jgi:transmembrane sensor